MAPQWYLEAVVLLSHHSDGGVARLASSRLATAKPLREDPTRRARAMMCRGLPLLHDAAPFVAALADAPLALLLLLAAHGWGYAQRAVASKAHELVMPWRIRSSSLNRKGVTVITVASKTRLRVACGATCYAWALVAFNGYRAAAYDAATLECVIGGGGAPPPRVRPPRGERYDRNTSRRKTDLDASSARRKTDLDASSSRRKTDLDASSAASSRRQGVGSRAVGSSSSLRAVVHHRVSRRSSPRLLLALAVGSLPPPPSSCPSARSRWLLSPSLGRGGCCPLWSAAVAAVPDDDRGSSLTPLQKWSLPSLARGGCCETS